MKNRTLPPFALFDYWGVPHEGTVGECAEGIRRLYAIRSAQPDWNQGRISEPAFGDNFRTWRLLNRMSLRYVSKTIGHRRRRLKVSENGYIRLDTVYSLVDLYKERKSFIFINVELQDGLFREIASGVSSHRQKFSPVKNPTIEKVLGHNLRWIRIHRVLTLHDASMRSGVPAGEIKKLEDGVGQDIAFSRLVQLGDIYDEPCPIKLMHPDYSNTGLTELAPKESQELKDFLEKAEALMKEISDMLSEQEPAEECRYEPKQH